MTQKRRVERMLWVGLLLFAAVLVLTSGRLRMSASMAVASEPGGTIGLRVDFASSSDRSDPRLDTPLTRLAGVAWEAPDQVIDAAQLHHLRLDAGERRLQVQLKIVPGSEGAVTAAIASLGGEVTGRYLNTLQAWVPPSQLKSLAGQPVVFRIQTPPRLMELEPGNGLLTSALSTTVTSEGLAALNGDTWHLGDHKGEGVKIAIIDGSFGGYRTLLGSELPSSVTVKNFVDGETDGEVGTSSSTHGTACAEIIHDVAPAAELYLVKIDTDLDLAEAVDYVIAQGVDIISTSIGWNGVVPNDGTGFFADLVALARAEGILWVTAAGNFGQTHWSGSFVDFGDGTHRFGSDQNLNSFSDEGSSDCYTISAGYPINVVLQWDDWSSVTQDYDLYLYYLHGDVWDLVTGSTDVQKGASGQRPVERIGISAPYAGCYGVVIARYAATRDVHFDLFAYNMVGLNVREPARSMANLADSPAAVTVGAVYHASPYGLETFSSRGPTNGPGGRPAGGFVKPDLVGYDGVSTASHGMKGFPGTSAATPHVAGAAALVNASLPDLGPDGIQQFLEDASLDQGDAGKDNEFGAGRLWLDNLLSIDLVDWPPIVPAGQSLAISWKVQLGGVADTYVRWDHSPSPGDPPSYAFQTGIYRDVGSGVYSRTLGVPGTAVGRYYFRAFVQDAGGSLWTEERHINIDPHEPQDDVRSTAHPLGAPVAGVESYIRDETDVDWYTFEITRPGTVFTVTVTPPSGVDLDVVLVAPGSASVQDDLAEMGDVLAVADIAAIAGIAGVDDITTVADTVASVDVGAGTGIVAVGAHPGSRSERVTHRVWFDAGPQAVMVYGYNGEHSSQEPYRLDIEVDASKAWDPAPLSLPVYSPPVSPTVRTLFVTHWDRINATYAVTASAEIMTALNAIMHDPKVVGTVVDLSNLAMMTSTTVVSDVYSAWDEDPADPYGASRVGLVVQDVISDALHSYPQTQYIVIVGDDSIVPFMRLPDTTAIGNEQAYRRISGATPESPAYAALDGGFYLTDDCYADPNPLSWPGGELCVPDYPIGRLVEAPGEIATILSTYSGMDGDLQVNEALVTGYDFLTDQAVAISDVLGSLVTVHPLIGDAWTAADLENAWIRAEHELQSVNARFDHFRVTPAERSGETLAVDEIAGNLWPAAVLGFAVGGHAGYTAHDAEFDETKSLDFAQAMAAEGAIWIANTGYGFGDGAGVSHSEDLALRFFERLAEGMAGDGVPAGVALMRAKQDYVAQAAPGSLDVYDRKALMEVTLYGLPHWSVGRGGSGTGRTRTAVGSDVRGLSSGKLTTPDQSRGIGSVDPDSVSTAILTYTRDITLTLGYELLPDAAGQVLDVTVESIGDSMGILTDTEKIETRSHISFGRPQLPILSFDAVYADAQVPRGVAILGGRSTDLTFDPIVTRIITDHVYDLTEPVYQFERWFPTQPVKIIRVGSHLRGGENVGQLALFPAQFRAGDAGTGTLRAFEQIRLRIYYQDTRDAGDKQAPVIRRVKTVAGADGVDITLNVIDPDPGINPPSGVGDVWLTYSTDGVIWKSDVPLTQSTGDSWSATIDLPPGGHAGNLAFVVQAVDRTGNVAYSSNKGEWYRGADTNIFVPLVQRSAE